MFTPILHEVNAGHSVTTGFSLSVTQTSFGTSSTSATDTATSVVVAGRVIPHNSTVVNLNGFFNQVTAPATAAPYTTATGATINGPFFGFATIRGNDIINAGLGLARVTVSDGDGPVTVSGSLGSASVVLGDGADSVTVGGFFNTVDLGNGNDTVSAGLGSGVVHLGDGADTVSLGEFGNVIAPGTGNDTITVPQGSTKVRLGDGQDHVTLAGYFNDVTIGDGNHVIVAGSGADSVIAGAGNNTISFAGYSNRTTLGAGTDLVNAGSGDTIAINGTTLTLKGGFAETITVGSAGGLVGDLSKGTVVKFAAGDGNLSLTNIANEPGFALDLLGKVGGYHTYAAVAKALTSDGHGDTLLSFASTSGTGLIDFVDTSSHSITASMFRFG